MEKSSNAQILKNAFAAVLLQEFIPLAKNKVPQYHSTIMLLSNELLFITAEKSALEEAAGGFSRQVAVLALEEPSSAANRDFLTKVMAAANLNLSQDALLAEIPAGEIRTLSPDLQEKKPKYVLVFGLPASQFGLSIQVQAYQPTLFYGSTWLFADRLSVLEPDKTKKTQLWSALKQMFL